MASLLYPFFQQLITAFFFISRYEINVQGWKKRKTDLVEKKLEGGGGGSCI